MFLARWVCLVLMLAAMFSASAQQYEQRLYRCFITEEMDDWSAVINSMEADFKLNKSSSTEFNLLHTYYGYIAYLISKGDEVEAQKNIERAQEHIQNLTENYPKCPEVLAIQASVMVFEIALNRFKILYLGNRSLNILNEAISIDSTNIYAIIEYGNFMLYAPSFAGGNVQMAIEYYQKAIEQLNQQNRNEPPRSWWYINTLTQLAIAYNKIGNNQQSIATYKQILTIEPTCKLAQRAVNGSKKK